MLYIEHLTKTFGEKKAVDDLSLHIAPGEIYGFIGHNGAGKTTTLKSVVGIQQFDSGRITIGGHSIQDDPIACKKMLAYIPDNPDLYEFMTGIQYLNFIADIFGVEESARQERIRKYADLFELTGDLAQPVAAYSHGMKQKLAIDFADLLYNGKWFTPLREALQAFAVDTQKHVTGTVKLKLYKGNIIPAGMTSPCSLYSENLVTFGESDYDQSQATGFINLWGLPTKVQALREQGKL